LEVTASLRKKRGIKRIKETEENAPASGSGDEADLQRLFAGGKFGPLFLLA
jgi:hypothetical protein